MRGTHRNKRLNKQKGAAWGVLIAVQRILGKQYGVLRAVTNLDLQDRSLWLQSEEQLGGGVWDPLLERGRWLTAPSDKVDPGWQPWEWPGGNFQIVKELGKETFHCYESRKKMPIFIAYFCWSQRSVCPTSVSHKDDIVLSTSWILALMDIEYLFG